MVGLNGQKANGRISNGRSFFDQMNGVELKGVKNVEWIWNMNSFKKTINEEIDAFWHFDSKWR